MYARISMWGCCVAAVSFTFIAFIPLKQYTSLACRIVIWAQEIADYYGQSN